LFVPGAKPHMMTEKMRSFYEKRRLFISPIGGRYTSGFGWREHPITHNRSFHPGLDLKARTGTVVCAARDGTVIAAGWVEGYGNCVIIQHQDGYTTLYGHNSALLTHTGAHVFKGQAISRAGSTGLSTAPHVHFEIRKDNKPINPADYLW
jgi:murein DD-endopeptidase MepM/ murein hydrolase activator NlpD